MVVDDVCRWMMRNVANSALPIASSSPSRVRVGMYELCYALGMDW